MTCLTQRYSVCVCVCVCVSGSQEPHCTQLVARLQRLVPAGCILSSLKPNKWNEIRLHTHTHTDTHITQTSTATTATATTTTTTTTTTTAHTWTHTHTQAHDWAMCDDRLLLKSPVLHFFLSFHICRLWVKPPLLSHINTHTFTVLNHFKWNVPFLFPPEITLKKILFHIVWQWDIMYSTSFCSSSSLKLWWWQWVKYSNPIPLIQPDIVASTGHFSTLDFMRIVLVGLKKFCIHSSTTKSMVLSDINMSVLRGLAVLCMVSIHSWRFVCTFFICLFTLIVRITTASWCWYCTPALCLHVPSSWSSSYFLKWCFNIFIVFCNGWYIVVNHIIET